MAKKTPETCCEKFKTMIGGQALIEGIMMRGPQKDAIVIRTSEGLSVEVSDRKLNTLGSYKTWPFLRGVFTFFDAYACIVRVIQNMHSFSYNTFTVCFFAVFTNLFSCIFQFFFPLFYLFTNASHITNGIAMKNSNNKTLCISMFFNLLKFGLPNQRLSTTSTIFV